MFVLHFIIPLIIFYFYRNKIMLLGLFLGNLIDLDHIYYRIIGKVPWFESACSELGNNCSIGFYPLHNLTLAFTFIAFASLSFSKNKKLKIAGWVCLGAFLNIALDYIHMATGIGI